MSVKPSAMPTLVRIHHPPHQPKRPLTCCDAGQGPSRFVRWCAAERGAVRLIATEGRLAVQGLLRSWRTVAGGTPPPSSRGSSPRGTIAAPRMSPGGLIGGRPEADDCCCGKAVVSL